MRNPVAALAFTALALCSLAANAANVRYEFSSSLAPIGPNAGSNFSGYVEFDSSLLVANTNINVASFSSWAFAWGNDFSWDNSNASFDASFDSFNLGAGLEATGVDLCFSATGICNTGQHPVARVSTVSVAATYNANGDQTSDAGAWRGPLDVPEPASLALVGLALAGLGVARRARA